MYSEAEKVKWLVIILIVILLVFGAHSYFLYYEYIPSVLGPYVGMPAVHAHIKKSLYAVAWFYRFWFVFFLAGIVGYIIGLHIAARRAKVVRVPENRQEPKGYLKKDSFFQLAILFGFLFIGSLSSGVFLTFSAVVGDLEKFESHAIRALVGFPLLGFSIGALVWFIRKTRNT